MYVRRATCKINLASTKLQKNLRKIVSLILWRACFVFIHFFFCMNVLEWKHESLFYKSRGFDKQALSYHEILGEKEIKRLLSAKRWGIIELLKEIQHWREQMQLWMIQVETFRLQRKFLLLFLIQGFCWLPFVFRNWKTSRGVRLRPRNQRKDVSRSRKKSN